ncbi:MAG TPA: 6-phosphogluconolactonase [Actinomycetota bacterium]
MTGQPTRPEPELRVVDNVAEAAVALFLELQPGTIVLSGGSTPQACYERLAEQRDYPWSRVEAFFGDERCVPVDHPDSDVGMANRALLSKVPARSYPIDGAACDADGYQATLRDRFGDHPRFDLALYGLGPDGHTASLFPGRPEVHEVERWVVYVPEAGQPPFVPRVTLTVPVLSAASVGIFLVSGHEKRPAMADLLAGRDVPASRMAPDRLIVLADPAAVP